MGDIAKLQDAIQQYAPDMQITADIAGLERYAVDGILPRFVVTPDSVEQVAQIVALVNQHEATLLARGGGSRMNVGGLPEHIDVALETGKLTRLLEHEAPDLTCHV